MLAAVAEPAPSRIRKLHLGSTGTVLSPRALGSAPWMAKGWGSVYPSDFLLVYIL